MAQVDDLDNFRDIARRCTDTAELEEIIADCDRDRDPVIRTKVKQIYETRLAELKRKQAEIDYYEQKVDQ